MNKLKYKKELGENAYTLMFEIYKRRVLDIRNQVDFYLDDLIKENQIDKLTIEKLNDMEY
jgi:hypothetical protein